MSVWPSCRQFIERALLPTAITRTNVGGAQEGETFFYSLYRTWRENKVRAVERLTKCASFKRE